MTEPNFDDATGRRRYFSLLDEASARLIDPLTGRVHAGLVRSIPCPLCGREGTHELLFVKDGFTFVRCVCSMVYVSPQLLPDRVHELYRGEDTFYASWTDVLLSEGNQRWQVPYFADMLDLLQRFTPAGDVLEIGCSIGLFLEQAQARGYRCTGLELEEQAFTHAKARGLTVYRRTLEESSFDDRSFDAVVMFGVLEHLAEPRRHLRQLRRLLRPGGVVMAVVPNVSSLAAMVLREQSRMFSGYNHLQYFSMDTLGRMLRAEQFEPISEDTVLTALDSILNRLQFVDPSAAPTTRFLPPALQFGDAASRAAVEERILAAGLGLRLRVIARSGG